MKTVMKKMFSLLLVAVLLVSAVPTAFADGEGVKCENGHTAYLAYTYSAATCTANRVDAYKCNGGDDCTWKNTAFLVEVANSKADHTEVIDAAVPATCGTTGKTEGKHCSACSTVLVAQTEVPMGTHPWNAGTITTPATCTTSGVKTYTCTYDAAHTKTEVIPATDHTWGTGVVTTEPDCIHKGVRTYTCSNDSSHTKTEEIAATGVHTWGNASCTEPVKCTVAGCQAINGSELGHTWILDSQTAATCTTAGSKEYHCGVCGTPKTETTPSLGHNIGSEGKCLRTGCGYTETTRYAVEFYLDYNENDDPVTKLVAKGTNIYSIYTPYRNGYAFEGWYTVSGSRVSESATVTGDSAYFAKWTQMAPHEVYVKFYTHGNTKTVVKYVDMHHYAKDGVISLDDLYTVAKKNFKARNNEDLYIQGPFTSSEWDIFTENSAYRNTREKIEVSQTSTTVIHAMVRNVDDSSSSSSSSKADSSNPKTGDMIFAPMMVLGASAACLATLFYLNKKRAY